MMGMLEGGSDGGSQFTMKMFVFALLMIFLVPLTLNVFCTSIVSDSEYEAEMEEMNNDYYNATGSKVTATTEMWALRGIYTPYSGGAYGYTDDGWIYGSLVKSYEPSQYTTASQSMNSFEVTLNEENGLYYYTKVAENDLSHTAATKTDTGWDFTNASVYTAVTMCDEHKSTTFFNPETKVTTDQGFYYEYTGYRYAFGPLEEYQTTSGGTTVTVKPNSTSLSLIWYQYASYQGIAGQLTLSGSDSGVSYLTAEDILREFNSATYSAVFDMTFNNVKMHLTIRMDVTQLNQGMSVTEAFNGGYWSVYVTSDAVASSSIDDSSYDFSIDNIFQTLIDLFTFKVAEKYNIDGWVAVIASLLVTMPLYAALIAIALDHYILLIGVAVLAAIQAISSIWPF